MKIRNKITYSYISIFILLTIIVIVFLSIYSSNLVKKDAYSYLVSTGHSRAEHIRTFIQEKKKSSILLAGSSIYYDFLREPVDSKEFPILKEKINKFLAQVIKDDSQIYEVFIMATSGKIILSSNPAMVGNDESLDDYFLQGKINIFFKDAYYPSGGKTLTYGISTPIKDNNGLLLGVSMLRFTTSDFHSIVTDIDGLGETEENFLINKDRFFITPSIFIGDKVILKQRDQTANADSCYNHDMVEYNKQNPNFNIEEQVFEVKDYRGVDVVSTHSYIPETGWCLITKVDLSAVLSFRYTLFLYAIITFIISFIIFYLISAYISRKITEPIISIITNINKIEKRDYNLNAAIDTNDEIGILSKALNKMSGIIGDYSRNLEGKVREQTKVITDKNVELDSQKVSILNVLDDLKTEKSKIEDTIKVRTEELSKEKSRLLSSINSFSFGFVISSNNGDIILSNPVLLEIFNIDKVPKSILDLAKILKKFDLFNTFKDCVNTQETIEINDIIYNDKILKISFAPVVNINTVIDYVLLFEDVTEMKLLERSKDEFLAVASHELRTPLTAIRGNADMILDTYKDKMSSNDVKEMLTDINNASIRLIGIVNSFLEVSRLEQGKIDISLESFDLSPIINKVISSMYNIIGKKKISLTYSPPTTDILHVFADKTLTEQVFINLISNAIKYTDEGSIVVTLETDRNFVTIKVIDTGKGIDPKNQLLLFRKFQQASGDVFVGDYATSSGLGLYISKLLVKNMGGDIGLEQSSLGSGSTFFFTLPVAV